MKKLISWFPVQKDCDFSIYNLPYGIFSDSNATKRVGIAIGNHVIDLSALLKKGIPDMTEVPLHTLENDFLNDFIALGKERTSGVRSTIQSHLTSTGSPLREWSDVIIPKEEVTMHMPVRVGDYTDFYSSIEHATNVGKMFRDASNALLPNWRHLPVGYHGRASSIIVSGENFHRPWGQKKPGEGDPVFGPSKRLDFELEMAFIIGKESRLGMPIHIDEAEDYIFGMVLFNDWSARDIQKWEYVPLGPFLGKSFASSVSPWVVTMEALEPFRIDGPQQVPPVLPYLSFEGKKNYDISLEVTLTPEGGEETVITRSNFKYMYWNMVQQLAHHTINGCNVRIGDMMASGTISGPERTSYGSMLELSWGGKQSIELEDGQTRTFLEDGDDVSMRGWAEYDEIRVGFGEVNWQNSCPKNGPRGTYSHF